LSFLSYLESLAPLPGEVSPADGLESHDLIAEPKIPFLFQVREGARAEKELKEETKSVREAKKLMSRGNKSNLGK
jgi:hypothetical protein